MSENPVPKNLAPPNPGQPDCHENLPGSPRPGLVALLSRNQQYFVFLIMGLLAVLMLIHWARLTGWGLEPVEVLRPEEHQYDYKIDINQASWVEWIQLAGIGQPTAEKIIQNREEQGPFTSVDDLIRVNGIGPKKLEKLRPWLTCPPAPAPAHQGSQPSAPFATSAP